jgi:hypothetical protein
MPTRLPHRAFNAEDREVYAAWLRKTLAAYAALALFGIGLVTIQAMTKSESISAYMADAISQAAP